MSLTSLSTTVITLSLSVETKWSLSVLTIYIFNLRLKFVFKMICIYFLFCHLWLVSDYYFESCDSLFWYEFTCPSKKVKNVTLIWTHCIFTCMQRFRFFFYFCTIEGKDKTEKRIFCSTVQEGQCRAHRCPLTQRDNYLCHLRTGIKETPAHSSTAKLRVRTQPQTCTAR